MLSEQSVSSNSQFDQHHRRHKSGTCNVILVPAGSHGDVHPLLGLGQTLAKCGHKISIIANEPFKPIAQKLGFEFLQLRSTDELRKSPPTVWHPRKSWDAMASRLEPEWRRQHQLIIDNYSESKGIVLAAGAAFGARLAQEKHGVRVATVHLSPICFRSLISPPVIHPALRWMNWLPATPKRLVFQMVDRAIDLAFVPRLNRLRTEMGLKTIRRPFNGWWNSPELVIAMFPAWFCAPHADWPPNTVMGDFVLFDDQVVEKKNSVAEEFLATEDPFIVFTPGTSASDSRSFLKAAIVACDQLGYRGLILSRRKKDVPTDLPDGIHHFQYLPFSKVFPNCAAVVHHGGIGTMAQAMAAGIPQLVLPKAFDQFDNADRIRRLGVGTSIGFGRNRNGKALARQLDTLISSNRARANCLAAKKRFAPVPHLEIVCERISQLAYSSIENKSA